MTDLIHRLETEPPSRGLADEVLLACGWTFGVGSATGGVKLWYTPDGALQLPRGERPNPLTDLNAAVQLVPEGWRVQLFEQKNGTWTARLCGLNAAMTIAPFEDEEHLTDQGWRGAKTPATALTIACLRAGEAT